MCKTGQNGLQFALIKQTIIQRFVVFQICVAISNLSQQPFRL